MIPKIGHQLTERKSFATMRRCHDPVFGDNRTAAADLRKLDDPVPFSVFRRLSANNSSNSVHRVLAGSARRQKCSARRCSQRSIRRCCFNCRTSSRILRCNDGCFLPDPVQIALRVGVNHRFIAASFRVAHDSPNNRFIDAGSAVFFDANERSAKVANTSARSRTVRGGIFIEILVESRADGIWNHSHQFFLKLVFERAARPAPAGDDAVLRLFELDVGFWKTRDIGIQNAVDHHVIVVEMKKTDVVRIGYRIPFFVDNYLIRSMDSFGVVVHVCVPVVRHREQLLERLSGAAFGRRQHPVGADDDATASNSFEVHEPFMRAELGSLAFNDSDLLSIGDRDII